MGILISGAVTVHLKFDINDRWNIKQYLDSCDCKLLILDPGENKEFYDVVQAVLSIYLPNAASKSSIGKVSSSIVLMKENKLLQKFSCLDDILKNTYADNIEYPVVFLEDTAVIMSTSGSTGTSKWIKHSHFGLWNVVTTLQWGLAFQRDTQTGHFPGYQDSPW